MSKVLLQHLRESNLRLPSVVQTLISLGHGEGKLKIYRQVILLCHPQFTRIYGLVRTVYSKFSKYSTEKVEFVDNIGFKECY